MIKIILISLLLSGCLGNIKSQIIWYDGREINIKSKNDGLVTVKLDGGEITVDNRGRPGFIEQIFGALLINGTVNRQITNDRGVVK